MLVTDNPTLALDAVGPSTPTVQYMISWTDAGRFTERSRTLRPITQDGDRRGPRRSQSVKHAAQLVLLRKSLRGNAAEHDLLALIILDLSEQNLEGTHLILTNRPDVTAINGKRDRFRLHRCRLRGHRDGFLLQSGANADCALAGCLHHGNVVERQELRQHRPGAAVG